MGGAWGWHVATTERLLKYIIPKLHNFESMTWADIPGTGSHEIIVDQICREAQDRLVEIDKNDEDTLFSLRLTGKRRVWGIRRGAILHLLWWDPEHSVYPTQRD